MARIKNGRWFTLAVKKLINGLFVLCLFSLIACSVSHAQVEGIDPSQRFSNARVIGMGRAFTALADDPSAMYYNPSGLARMKNWALSSMSGKFVDDYNYLSLMGYYPTNIGVIGIGYGKYEIGGAYATTIDANSSPDDPIYIIDPTQLNNPISNYNSAFSIAYASTLDKFLGKYISWSDRIDVGANFKLFSAGLSGDHISNGWATGQELDAGVLTSLTPWARVGLSMQNLLPADMGGKITYVSSGHIETFPAQYKLGGYVKVLGEDKALRSFMKQDLSIALDYESKFNPQGVPALMHLGAEWSPNPMVSIRAGLDQMPADDGTGKYTTFTNPTYGIGLNYSGFKFDYAYHQFYDLPLDSAYFSLSYVPPEKKVIAVKLKLNDPKDDIVTFNSIARVSGQVFDPDIKSVELNGNKILVAKNGSFDAESPISVGKNKLVLLSYGEKGKLQKPLNEQSVRVLRLTAFPDVPEGYWVRQPISLVAMLNIVTGYPDGSFKPEGNITRAEMATLLMRSQIPDQQIPGNVVKFKDVKDKHWAAKFIAQAAAAKVVEGYPDKTFKPNGNITRAEGLAMVARFAQVSKEAYSSPYFSDITEKNWAAQIIAGSSKAGLLEFLKGKQFEPKRKLTRAEAVEILSRTGFVKGLLDKDLLNWNSY